MSTPGELAQIEILKKQIELKEEEIQVERVMRSQEQRDSLVLQGAKVLCALNAGAIVAVFAFLQALLDHPPAYSSFRLLGTLGLLAFAFGIVFSIQTILGLADMVETPLPGKSGIGKISSGLERALMYSAGSLMVGLLMNLIGLAIF